jgi:hypothetical protein
VCVGRKGRGRKETASKTIANEKCSDWWISTNQDVKGKAKYFE